MKKWNILLFLLLSISVFSQEDSARDLIKKAQDQLKLIGSESTSRLIIRNSRGQERERRIASISLLREDGTEDRLIRFLSPADVKGTSFLTHDYEEKSDDMWLYLPALKKVRRIQADDKGGNFMGSEFTYGDTTAFSLDDFEFELAGSEVVNEADCNVILQIPRTKRLEREYGFSQKKIFLGKADLVIRKAEYYDTRMALERVLTAEDIREIQPGFFRAFHMTMENLKNNRSSELQLEQLKITGDIPREYFTLRYLQR